MTLASSCRLESRERGLECSQAAAPAPSLLDPRYAATLPDETVTGPRFFDYGAPAGRGTQKRISSACPGGRRLERGASGRGPRNKPVNSW